MYLDILPRLKHVGLLGRFSIKKIKKKHEKICILKKKIISLYQEIFTIQFATSLGKVLVLICLFVISIEVAHLIPSMLIFLLINFISFFVLNKKNIYICTEINLIRMDQLAKQLTSLQDDKSWFQLGNKPFKHRGCSFIIFEQYARDTLCHLNIIQTIIITNFGYVVIKFYQSECFITNIYVTETRRNKGLGKKLLMIAEEYIKAKYKAKIVSVNLLDIRLLQGTYQFFTKSNYKLGEGVANYLIKTLID